jgi:hypothetical protein
MNEKVNLAEKVRLLERPYNPGIVGYLNDYKLAVVKVCGEFVWHKHEDADPLSSGNVALAPDRRGRGVRRWTHLETGSATQMWLVRRLNSAA